MRSIAVLPSRAFLLSDDSLLVVPVGDLHVDGKRLEGRGVKPDVKVPFSIPYANGKDPQKARGLEVLKQRVGVSNEPGEDR